MIRNLSCIRLMTVNCIYVEQVLRQPRSEGIQECGPRALRKAASLCNISRPITNGMLCLVKRLQELKKVGTVPVHLEFLTLICSRQYVARHPFNPKIVPNWREEVLSRPQWNSLCQRSVKNSFVGIKGFLQYPEGPASLDVWLHYLYIANSTNT